MTSTIYLSFSFLLSLIFFVAPLPNTKVLELLNDAIRGEAISEACALDERFKNTPSTIPDSNILPDAPLSPDTSLSSGVSLARPPRPHIQMILEVERVKE